MLVRVAGDAIMMSPPFVITPEEVDKVCFMAYHTYMCAGN